MPIYRLGIVALIVVITSFPGVSQPRNVKSMPDPKIQNLLAEAAKWPEERYFSHDAETARRFETELSRSNAAGFWIAAPKSLAVEKRASLPLLLLAHFSAMREWEVAEEANAILVTSPLSSGPMQPCFAFPSDKRWQPGDWGSRQGAPPGPDERTIFTSQIRTLDARALCKIPWKAGRVAVTHISYDLRSDTIITELTGPPVETKPIPAERAAAFRRKLFPAKFEMGKFPSYAASTYHREVSGQGIGLRIPSNIAATAESIPALGTIRIPLPAYTWVEGHDPDLPVALLPAQILILQLDNPHRGVIPVTIPVYADSGKTLHAGDVVEAHFAIDLYPYINPSLEPGEYLAYLVVAEFVSDPAKVIIVTR